MRLIFLILIALISNINADTATIDKQQLANLKMTYTTGKGITLPNGDDLALTLATLSFRETSFMTNMNPAQVSTKYYILVNGKKQYFKMTQKFNESKKQVVDFKGKKYVVNKEVYYGNDSLGPMEMKLSTAKVVIKKTPQLKKYLPLLKNNAELVKLIHTDKQFAVKLAGYYLIICYKEGEQKFGKNGNANFVRAISRYNGGWNNIKYLSKFRKDRMFVKHLVKVHRIDNQMKEI